MNMYAQFGFQNRHAAGVILNVGSNCDPAGLGARGAVNVDLHRVSPATGIRNRVDALADARALPFRGAFDTVVIGDLLEHLRFSQIIRVLREAKRALRPQGKIVVTCPDDHRTIEEQAQFGKETEYAPGVQALHARRMPLELLWALVELAGLRVRQAEIIHYPHYSGWGLVVC